MYLEKNILAKDFFEDIVSSEIKLHQFSWNELETINESEEYSNYLTEQKKRWNITEKKIYFFSTYATGYPIDFKFKHWGLWKSREKQYNFDYISETAEKQYNLLRMAIIYGCCQLHYTDKIFQALLDNVSNSWILISNQKYDLKFLINQFITVTDKKFKVSFMEAINYYCTKGDSIITAIHGPWESAINYFTLENW